MVLTEYVEDFVETAVLWVIAAGSWAVLYSSFWWPAWALLILVPMFFISLITSLVALLMLPVAITAAVRHRRLRFQYTLGER